MTTLTAGARPTSPHHESSGRILAVARLHFVNRFQLLYLPAIILVFILLVNIVIWVSILAALSGTESRADAERGFSNSGAEFYLFVYSIIVAVQAIVRTFPFSLGFGVTRRDFSLGSAVAFVALAAIFAALLTVMSVIEDWTNGWGVGGHMFSPVYFTSPNVGLRFVMDFLLLLFCFFVGSAIASVYVRWRMTGMVTFFAIVTVIILAGVTSLTLGHGWAAFGTWVVTQGALGMTAWALIPTVVAAVAGYFLLRRATPKN